MKNWTLKQKKKWILSEIIEYFEKYADRFEKVNEMDEFIRKYKSSISC